LPCEHRAGGRGTTALEWSREPSLPRVVSAVPPYRTVLYCIVLQYPDTDVIL